MSKKPLVFAILIIVFIGFTLIFIKPQLPRSFHHQVTNNTTLIDEKVNGFQLFDTIQNERFVDIYGELRKKSRNHDVYNYYKLQDGLEIATNSKGGILRFIVDTPILTTSRGIKVGDSLTKVKKAYGNHYYQRSEQGIDIIGYVDKKNHLSIEFWISNRHVLFYRLDEQSME